MRAVIIDDEADARKNLSLILEEFCEDVTLTGEASSALEGVKLIQSTNPNVVFLDIEMPNGTGFDLLDCIDSSRINVIFVTAYNEYAVKAFQYSAVDYLLKPIDIELLKQSISKIRTNSEEERGFQKNQLQAMMNVYENNHQKIAIPTIHGFDFVQINDIIRIEADRSYVKLILAGEKKMTVSRNLKDFENVLPQSIFFRTHKSHLINVNRILKYLKSDGGKVEMEDGYLVDVSRSKREKFSQFIRKV